jgi:putative ABC transport system substrate-binding protein
MPTALRRYAAELVALAPDVLFWGGGYALAALQQVIRTVPTVFANVVDPVGLGYVANLAPPSGNSTGFMAVEFGRGQPARWRQPVGRWTHEHA